MEAYSFDLLIKNGLVLTLNPRMDLFHPGAVAIKGDTIVAVGPEKDLQELEGKSKRVIDAQGGAVLPGLINAHTHAAMTLFRGLADDLPLAEWLEEHIFPAEKKIRWPMGLLGDAPCLRRNDPRWHHHFLRYVSL